MTFRKGLILYDYANNRRIELLEDLWSGRAACICVDLDELGCEYLQHFTSTELKKFEVVK